MFELVSVGLESKRPFVLCLYFILIRFLVVHERSGALELDLFLFGS